MTDCSGLKDVTNFTTTYDGTTTKKAGVNDGVNTVDKADLSKSDVRVDRDRLHLDVVGRGRLRRDRHPLRYRREVVQQGRRRHVRLPGHRRPRVRAHHRPQLTSTKRQADDALPGHPRLHRPAHAGPRRHPRGPRALRRLRPGQDDAAGDSATTLWLSFTPSPIRRSSPSTWKHPVPYPLLTGLSPTQFQANGMVRGCATSVSMSGKASALRRSAEQHDGTGDSGKAKALELVDHRANLQRPNRCYPRPSHENDEGRPEAAFANCGV